MYGTVIGNSIAVDGFEEVTQDGIYFLSEAQYNGLLPPHVDRIYTSVHNAWLLRTKLKMDRERVVSLAMDQKFHIQDKMKNLDFFVTLLDAKQKPGAVMFLFEGNEIGTILYAGKCCYSDNFCSKPLTNLLKIKQVDYLYVHAACMDCQSHSMSAADAVTDIINVIRWNPKCKIVIHEPYFREDILKSLRLRLRKSISVSKNIMRHLEELGLGSDFQLNKSSAQVYVTDKNIGKEKFSKLPVFNVILIPCSMKRTPEEIQVKLYKLEKKGYHVILYRNHCSPPELVNMVRCINAKHTVQVRPEAKIGHPVLRPKDVLYWSHFGNMKRIFDFMDKIDQMKQQTHNLVEEVSIMEDT